MLHDQVAPRVRPAGDDNPAVIEIAPGRPRSGRIGPPVAAPVQSIPPGPSIGAYPALAGIRGADVPATSAIVAESGALVEVTAGLDRDVDLAGPCGATDRQEGESPESCVSQSDVHADLRWRIPINSL